MLILRASFFVHIVLFWNFNGLSIYSGMVFALWKGPEFIKIYLMKSSHMLCHCLFFTLFQLAMEFMFLHSGKHVSFFKPYVYFSTVTRNTLYTSCTEWWSSILHRPQCQRYFLLALSMGLILANILPILSMRFWI